MKKRDRSEHPKPAPIEHMVEVPAPTDPIEFAKLAAILRPAPGLLVSGEEADRILSEAFEEAGKFYFEAVQFLHGWPADFNDVLNRFSTHQRKTERSRRIFQETLYRERERDALRLEPKKKWDKARQYLGEEAERVGLPFSKGGHYIVRARTVLERIRKLHESLPKNALTAPYRLTWAAFKNQLKRRENGGTIYKLSKPLLEELVLFDKKARRESKDKSWQTRRSKAVQEEI